MFRLTKKDWTIVPRIFQQNEAKATTWTEGGMVAIGEANAWAPIAGVASRDHTGDPSPFFPFFPSPPFWEGRGWGRGRGSRNWAGSNALGPDRILSLRSARPFGGFARAGGLVAANGAWL